MLAVETDRRALRAIVLADDETVGRHRPAPEHGFNFFGADNTVAAGPGPLTLAGSVLQDGLTVTQENPGIAINNNRIGGPAATSGQSSNVPRQASLVRNSLNFSPTGNNAASNSGNTSSPGGSALKSVSDQITRSVKKFSDTVSKVTGGLGVGAKTGAASTSNKSGAATESTV